MKGIEIDQKLSPGSSFTKLSEQSPSTGAGKLKWGWPGKKGFSDKRKEAFYNELHVMNSTGIDLRSALEIMTTDQNKTVNTIVKTIHDDLVKGKSFSQSLEALGCFSPYEFISIRIGEETGMLTSVLNQLAHHFSSKVKQKRLLINALSYPLLVLITSIGAVIFMLQVVVPMFEDVFKRFGNDLPAITRAVIYVSSMISEGYGYIVFGTFVFTAIAYLNRGSSIYQEWLAKILLGVPVLGPIMHYNQLSRFSSAMYLLTSARHPLIDALRLVREMTTFYPVKVSLGQIAEDVEKGSQLYKAMSNHKIYPKKMIALIAIGEEVNRVDEIFLKIAGQYTEEVQYKSGVLSSVLEPVLIIFIGVMVAVILVAMYLPLFELSTNIG